MLGYKTLILKEGQEFSIHRTKEIDTGDIFWKEYVRCADIVETIVNTNASDRRIGCNNIIAFCGDRGTGKTSVMVNFGYELINRAGKSTLLREKTKEKKFVPLAKSQKEDTNIFADFEDLVIDPSILDGGHGLLDILLPSLYSRVDEKWKSLGEDEIEKRAAEYDKLMTEFQDVYRDISVLKSKERPNYEEAIYANSDRLFDLSSAVDLRVSLRELIILAKNFIIEEDGDSYFVLMLDDVDLCSGNAYRVLEEIRKYLLIPEIIILMAIRIEQMEMCIRDMNYSEFKNLIAIENKDEIRAEINLMAYKYMLKIIPESKRISLSEAFVPETVCFITADTDENEGKTEYLDIDTFVHDSVLSTTDIFIGESCLNCIRPSSLRGLINYLVYFNSLKDRDIYEPGKKILNKINDLVIREDETYYIKRQLWEELINASSEDFVNCMNRILREEYSVTKKEVTIKDILWHGYYEKTKTEKVYALIQAICALKEDTIIQLGTNAVLIENFWYQEIRKKGKSTGHIIVDTKAAVERMTGSSCNWLNAQSGRNSRKLSFNKSNLLKSKNPVKEVGCLYKILMFADSSKVRCSKTTANFIDREIELGYDNYLNNMYNSESNLFDLGLYECFNYSLNQTSSITIAEAVIDNVIPNRMISSNIVEKTVGNIFRNRQMQLDLANGRKDKEKSETPEERITSGAKRVLIEAFGQRGYNYEVDELYEAFDLFFNLCEIGQEVKLTDKDANNRERRKIPNIASFLKEVPYYTAFEYESKIENAVSLLFGKFPDFGDEPSMNDIYQTYLRARQSFEDYCESKPIGAVVDHETRVRYRDLYNAAYDVLNYSPDITGDETNDGE